MLKTFIKNIFSPTTSTPNWSPAKQHVVRNEKSKLELETIGYTVPLRLNPEKLNQLKVLYNQTHNFNLKDGGMFYSVYSEDISYRKNIHDSINQILSEVYNELFENYKIIINSFIVKVNGSESEFSLHQDSTGLDEIKYSPLSVWIPLQETVRLGAVITT